MIKILDFYADWCKPCVLMKPAINELSKEFDVQKIDVDKDAENKDKYGVMGIPTVIILKDDKELKRFSGVTSADTIKKAVLGL